MQLTKQQVARLKQIQIYRQATPTFLGVLRRSRGWAWAVLALALVFGLFAIAPNASPRYGWFLLGFIVGSLYVSFATVIRALKLWPLSREITNWNRVDELLRENETTPS